jgi:GH24 family phage-related lysozyme (muramidase)
VGDPDIDAATETRWFAEDWHRAYLGALTLVPKLDAIDEVRRDAVIWCAFNMGVGTLSQFAPFIRFVRLGKWSEAAFHLLTNMSGHLTPYLEQTGARAAETALRICSGEVLEEFRA